MNHERKRSRKSKIKTINTNSEEEIQKAKTTTKLTRNEHMMKQEALHLQKKSKENVLSHASKTRSGKKVRERI